MLRPQPASWFEVLVARDGNEGLAAAETAELKVLATRDSDVAVRQAAVEALRTALNSDPIHAVRTAGRSGTGSTRFARESMSGCGARLRIVEQQIPRRLEEPIRDAMQILA